MVCFENNYTNFHCPLKMGTMGGYVECHVIKDMRGYCIVHRNVALRLNFWQNR
jgi:hypothetical protein